MLCTRNVMFHIKNNILHALVGYTLDWEELPWPLSSTGLTLPSHFTGTITPGLAGLSITYALEVTGMLNWLIRSVCDLETQSVALEVTFEIK